MSETLLQVRHLAKRFGGFVALAGIELHVGVGERVGLIGPNGSGKSTLVNCICGTLVNDRGSVVFDGRDLEGLAPHRRTRLGMARTFQIPKPFASMSVAENLSIPLIYAIHNGAGPRRHGDEVRDEALGILRMVGLERRADDSSASLTQVEMRKLELARAVATRPKLLISDEAMAGLSNVEVDDILALLMRLNGEGIAVVMIEHIMRAVMKFSERVMVLVAGRKIADATPEAVIRNPEVERAYLGE